MHKSLLQLVDPSKCSKPFPNSNASFNLSLFFCSSEGVKTWRHSKMSTEIIKDGTRKNGWCDMDDTNYTNVYTDLRRGERKPEQQSSPVIFFVTHMFFHQQTCTCYPEVFLKTYVTFSPFMIFIHSHVFHPQPLDPYATYVSPICLSPTDWFLPTYVLLFHTNGPFTHMCFIHKFGAHVCFSHTAFSPKYVLH